MADVMHSESAKATTTNGDTDLTGQFWIFAFKRVVGKLYGQMYMYANMYLFLKQESRGDDKAPWQP